MHAQSKTIAVYGAAGHTGQFVVREALRRGLSVIAVGRSAPRLKQVLPQQVLVRVAALEAAEQLRQAFANCALVVNCAGPFLDSAAPILNAALQAGCHYIDVTAEQASAQNSFADFDTEAHLANRVVIPAAGFYGGLADLLASALATQGQIDAITVAVALDRWWPTHGTRKTGARNTAPRLVVTEGQITPMQPDDEVPDWHFAPPLGNQQMVELPFSEIIALARHLKVDRIRSFLNRSALADIRDPTTPAPTAVDDRGRSAQRFEMQVRLVQNGTTKIASACGLDIYAVTAPIVVETALQVLAPSYYRSGALALGEAVDPLTLLRALGKSALELGGDLFNPDSPNWECALKQ